MSQAPGAVSARARIAAMRRRRAGSAAAMLHVLHVLWMSTSAGAVWSDMYASAPSAAVQRGPERLRCEHAASPLIGLDVETPRFSWAIPPSDDGAAYGVVAASFQVQVADAVTAKVVWDSGTVASSALSTVYGGPALARDTSFSWRVRYWPGKGDGSSTDPSRWSTNFRFHTAPSSADWANASWIDGSRGALRSNIPLPSGSRIVEAFVFASSIGFHHVLVNGMLLGNQSTYLFEPGQSAYS